MKIFAFSLMFAVISQPSFAYLGSFARNEEGSIKLLKQHDAAIYCVAQGGRLPTAREMALHAQSFGAIGLIEVEDHVDTDHDSYLVTANWDGTNGHFYYNPGGYKAPPLDTEIYSTNWTYSTEDTTEGIGYYFDWSDGLIEIAYDFYVSPVRCEF